MEEIGIEENFVQDNESMSHRGVLRGLHFQAPPFAQGKLVRVVSGKVLDVVVDIRKGSPAYGETYSVILSAENKYMLYVPPGFAHGFATLENNTVFQYKCTQVYNKESEGALNVFDPKLNIEWGIDSPLLSEKDQLAPTFDQFNSPFVYVE
jgi:dTDP-4-dehydrorhamnose 3,5-epimerase